MLRLILLLILISQINLFSQSGRVIDSLKKEAQKTTGVEKLNVVFKLAELSKELSLDESLRYSMKALDISYKLQDSSLIAKALLKISFYEFLKYDMAKSSEYLTKAFSIYKSLSDSTGIAKVYLQKGLIKWRKGELDEALTFYFTGLKLNKNLNNRDGAAKALNYIGLIFWKKGDYSQALKNFLSSLKIKNDIGNKYEIGLTLNNIGKLFNELRDYKKSIRYSERALALSDSVSNKYIRGRALNNLGLSFAGLKQYKKALDYLKKAKKIKQNFNDKIGLGFTDEDIGNTYRQMGNNDKALEFYNKSLHVREQTNDEYGIASILIKISKIQIDSNNLSIAYATINRGMQISKRLGAKNLLKECYRLLSYYYSKISNNKKAYLYLGKYVDIKDSLFNETNSKKIAEMDARYKIDRIEKEVSSLKQQKIIKELELKRQNAWRIFLIFVSISMLLIVTAILFWVRFKKKSYAIIDKKNMELIRANEMLAKSENSLKEINATKDKLFSIVAHDLKNPFNSILGFYDLLIKEYKDLTDSEKLEYIAAIGKSINNSYSLLENLLQWSRSQMGAIKIGKRKLELNLLCSSVINETMSQAKRKKIKIIKNCPNSLSVIADEFMINTVLRNILTNAIKFSNINGKVTISAEPQNDNFVAISVEDTGVGMTKETLKSLFTIAQNNTTLGTSHESGTGLGLIIVKEFVEKNNGTISVESKEGKGSKFTVTLPTSENV